MAKHIASNPLADIKSEELYPNDLPNLSRQNFSNEIFIKQPF
jgi:hypothetical protein